MKYYRIRTELEYKTSYRLVRTINGLRAPSIRVPRLLVAAWQGAPREIEGEHVCKRVRPMIAHSEVRARVLVRAII